MTVAERTQYLVKNYSLNPVFAMRVASEQTDLSPENISQVLKGKAKPFVKWVGGKRQLLNQFKEKGLYPPEGFNPLRNTYFEPFVGGGAVFFDLLPTKAHINDINTDLVITYRTVKSDVTALIEELNSGQYIYDKDVFYNIRSWKTDSMPDIKRAARFVYLNRTAFNGMYRVNRKGEFNVPFGRYNNPQICDTENLLRVSETLTNVSISNDSYTFVLQSAEKGDFVYFDPPYYPVSKTSSFTSYSSEVFLEKEQQELHDTYIELHKRGCFVMLSNSDTPFIEGLFKPFKKEGVHIHRVQAGRAINSKSEKRGKISEVIVTNY